MKVLLKTIVVFATMFVRASILHGGVESLGRTLKVHILQLWFQGTTRSVDQEIERTTKSKNRDYIFATFPSLFPPTFFPSTHFLSQKNIKELLSIFLSTLLLSTPPNTFPCKPRERKGIPLLLSTPPNSLPPQTLREKRNPVTTHPNAVASATSTSSLSHTANENNNDGFPQLRGLPRLREVCQRQGPMEHVPLDLQPRDFHEG